MGIRPTYDIEVDHECHNFIANGIVTHNSHATCYGYIAYADMYLKQHFPLQFMCSALQARSKEIYIKDCARMGIKVLPPCVNRSGLNYQIEGGDIRVGLGDIKHVGKASKILAGRPFRDEFDFLERTKPGRKVLDALVYAGALDAFGDRGQIAYRMCDIKERATIGHLAMSEKEHLGFYLVYNPLGECEEQLKGIVTPETSHPMRASVGGMISRVKVHDAKSGPMAFVVLLTSAGEMDCLVWPSDYQSESKKLVEGNIIIAQGRKTDKGNYSMSKIKVLRNV